MLPCVSLIRAQAVQTNQPDHLTLSSYHWSHNGWLCRWDHNRSGSRVWRRDRKGEYLQPSRLAAEKLLIYCRPENEEGSLP